MSKLTKIYEYIDSLYPIYGDNANIKNYVGNIIQEHNWGQVDMYMYYVDLVSKTSLFLYHDMTGIDIEAIKAECKAIIAEYTNSFNTYEDRDILLELPKITYLKNITNYYTRQSLDVIRDVLLYSLYLKLNRL